MDSIADGAARWLPGSWLSSISLSIASSGRAIWSACGFTQRRWRIWTCRWQIARSSICKLSSVDTHWAPEQASRAFSTKEHARDAVGRRKCRDGLRSHRAAVARTDIDVRFEARAFGV